ncbi:MurR/RpiR family transcriptional regulator [Mycoplasmopsis fermentans]|uniref:MurR/RpiR family transcriptional regulator n=1 Tax=Mycoplasmopsis fermentans TaxID=2115 RepID=UPI0001E32F1B|nr:MurR/RpiR family transcriptional regulator [Mycoplasmopsis fermentans]ADN68688.1 putative transcriptional regulator [Mycoplasmopsis fermentans JER]
MKNNDKRIISRPLMDDTVELTKSEKRIRDFINNFEGNYFNFSQNKLAKNTESSDAGVSRFIRKYGFKDYRTFIASINNKLTEFEKTYPTIWNDNEVDNDYKFIAASHRYAIDNVYDEDLIKDINKAAEIINKSKNIYIHGCGSSQRISMNLVSNLLKIGKPVIAHSDFHIFFPSLAHVTENDVVIVYSNNLQTMEAHFVIEQAKKQKAPIIVLTSSQEEDKLIAVKLRYHKIQSSTMLVPSSSKIAQMLITDLLFEAVLEHNKENTSKLKKARILIKNWSLIDKAHSE